eukprot:6200270-Pleurochrysis_carterae.AAC.1
MDEIDAVDTLTPLGQSLQFWANSPTRQPAISRDIPKLARSSDRVWLRRTVSRGHRACVCTLHASRVRTARRRLRSLAFEMRSARASGSLKPSLLATPASTRAT